MAGKNDNMNTTVTTEGTSPSLAKMLEEAECKVGEMLTGAEVRAKEIVEAAQQKAAEIVEAASVAFHDERDGLTSMGPTEEEFAIANKKVSVELFKDNNLYKDDVYIAVNGENIKIQRGKTVEIDQKFKEVLDNSCRQDAAAADLNEQLDDDFKKKSTALE